MDALIRFTLRKFKHVYDKSSKHYGSVVASLNLIVANLDQPFQLYNPDGTKIKDCFIKFTKDTHLKV